MKKYLLILILAIFSCDNIKSGKFIQPEKTIIVLDKIYDSFNSYYFIVYFKEPLKIKVNKATFDYYKINDTIKNVGVIEN